MPRARNEMFDQERDPEQKREHQPADPPAHGSPQEPRQRLTVHLEEEDAGGGEGRSGKEKTGTKNQGDAILGALKAHQGDSGEDEGKQAGGDLEVAMENGIRSERSVTQPVCRDEDQYEARQMKQEAS